MYKCVQKRVWVTALISPKMQFRKETAHVWEVSSAGTPSNPSPEIPSLEDGLSSPNGNVEVKWPDWKGKSCGSTRCGFHIAGGKSQGHSSLHEATLKTYRLFPPWARAYWVYQLLYRTQDQILKSNSCALFARREEEKWTVGFSDSRSC